MKSISERALEYTRPLRMCGELSRADDIFNGYTVGATEERALLMKWNSPDNHPTDNHYVIGKFTGDRVYRLVYYDDLWKEWKLEWTHEIAHIVGWREIYE